MNYRVALGGLLALLLLGGCNVYRGSYAAYGDAPADTVRGQCERAAYDDPAVKKALAVSTGRASNAADAVTNVTIAKNAAVQRCLAQHGAFGKGGGVELPR
jgi:hypothetical protein